ncbi:MAG: nuclease-related domain-containing protein [Kiritimatiellae bacterium]|nr:nuclease-related domain-containing protein [Kiritimatiellia bacterium]
MANFIGTAGGFQKEKAINRRLNAIMAFFISFTVAIFLLGWVSGFIWGRRSLWSSLWAVLALAVAVPAFKLFEKLFDKQIRLSRMEQDGAAGEFEFVKFLKDLPDTYTVINDLDFADSYGNIDHLIVGPSGVFAIDVKNWRGTVTPDGKGELLYNGRPTDKPQIRYFTRRVMDLKGRFKALTKLDPYVQCVFAFMRTRVDAKWGTTAAVHCICAEQISDYVTKFRVTKPIPPADIPRLIKAAEALRELAAKEPCSSARNPSAQA